MAGAKLSVDFSDIEQIEQVYRQAPITTENAINEYLHGKGLKLAQERMTELVPVSDRPKLHAKRAQPYSRTNKVNLGFEVQTAVAFNYLVFPDEGLGTSKRKMARQFSQAGMDAATPQIVDELTGEIITALNGG